MSQQAGAADQLDQVEESNMTLMEHLVELRTRMMWIGGAVIIATLVAMIFAWDIVEILNRPLGGYIPQAIGPTDNLAVFFKVALASGAAAAMPIIFYQVIAFITPGLYPHERRALLMILPGAMILFVIGVVFAFFVMIPPAVRFLQGFGGENIRTEWTASLYIGFITRITFWIGVAFEAPLVVGFFARIGLISGPQLLRFWRQAVVFIAIAAAFITPTIDPVNMTIVMGPLIVLFFFSVAIAYLMYRPREPRDFSEGFIPEEYRDDDHESDDQSDDDDEPPTDEPPKGSPPSDGAPEDESAESDEDSADSPDVVGESEEVEESETVEESEEDVVGESEEDIAEESEEDSDEESASLSDDAEVYEVDSEEVIEESTEEAIDEEEDVNVEDVDVEDVDVEDVDVEDVDEEPETSTSVDEQLPDESSDEPEQDTVVAKGFEEVEVTEEATVEADTGAEEVQPAVDAEAETETFDAVESEPELVSNEATKMADADIVADESSTDELLVVAAETAEAKVDAADTDSSDEELTDEEDSGEEPSDEEKKS